MAKGFDSGELILGWSKWVVGVVAGQKAFWVVAPSQLCQIICIM